MSRAPRDARYRANAFPIPEDAPVTQIVFPLTFMDDYQFSSWGYGVIWGHSTFISLRSVKFFRILENWKTISNKCAILICRKRGNGMARPKNESVILRVKQRPKQSFTSMCHRITTIRSAARRDSATMALQTNTLTRSVTGMQLPCARFTNARIIR